ncbi:TD and POZ domain-containing protein 5 [Araneus ventricosus]|uniref:TD and POZ domain-containing protein 5 n=1 Tax=Araneus ventricosus TaxID=182803 RepID=A0A4Y2HIY9_ARAVE|nr:TD and POZ domain-containing protein 5 [Araneus ventricosus]
MASRNDGEANGCTSQWKIENVSQSWWLKEGERIQSPAFVADGLEGTKWSLWFFPNGEDGDDEDFIGIYLHREKDCSGPDIIEVNYHFAFLGKDDSVICEETTSDSFGKDEICRSSYFVERERIFITEREAFLPEDALTVQCTIWNKEEKPIRSKHLYAKTVFNVNRRSLVWRIDKFSTRRFALRNKLNDGLIDFDLVLNERLGLEKEIVIIMNSFDKCTKYFSFQTSIVDSEGKKENCGMNEYFADDLKKGVLSCILNFPKTLMEDKSLYLPNDVLCLNCEFVFSTETVLFRQFQFFGSGITSTELKNEDVGKEKSGNTTILSDDLKSMYNDGILSDTELRTSTQTFPAHRNILSARSPVFRRMFSNDMKEKSSGHVDIADLEDDTVRRMLLYVYTDSLEDLQYESASKLYTAADKYDIFSLKCKCSSFLKDNLCPTKACDVLILADQHQDNDLKSTVQDYILDHEEVFSSQEWVHFMDINIKLAADIMYKKINPCNV